MSAASRQPAFSERLDRAVCAAEWGLDPNRTTFLMMSGGLDALAAHLLAMRGEYQLITLAGVTNPC